MTRTAAHGRGEIDDLLQALGLDPTGQEVLGGEAGAHVVAAPAAPGRGAVERVLRLPLDEVHAAELGREALLLRLLPARLSTRVPRPRLLRDERGGLVATLADRLPGRPARADELVALAADVSGLLTELAAVDVVELVAAGVVRDPDGGGPGGGGRSAAPGRRDAWAERLLAGFAQLREHLAAAAGTGAVEQVGAELERWLADDEAWDVPTSLVHGGLGAEHLRVVDDESGRPRLVAATGWTTALVDDAALDLGDLLVLGGAAGLDAVLTAQRLDVEDAARRRVRALRWAWSRPLREAAAGSQDGRSLRAAAERLLDR